MRFHASVIFYNVAIVIPIRWGYSITPSSYLELFILYKVIMNYWDTRAWGGKRGSTLPPRCIITAEKEIDLDTTFYQKDNNVPLKPLGLWYSIRDSYIKFINFKQKFDEDSILPKNLNIYKLTIYPNSLTTDIKIPIQIKSYN
jgi:hypothetical protein